MREFREFKQDHMLLKGAIKTLRDEKKLNQYGITHPSFYVQIKFDTDKEWKQSKLFNYKKDKIKEV